MALSVKMKFFTESQNLNSLSNITEQRAASTAAVDSRRGTVTGLIGETRDFAKTRVTEILPFISKSQR